MRLRRRAWMVTGVAAVAWLAIFHPWTIRPIAEAPRGPFDANAYVAQIWDARALPALRSRAVAFEDFQRQHIEHATPVSIDGNVVAVDTSSRVGTAAIDVAPADGHPDALLVIGPVVRGTALRDALGFIQFTDFTNQIQFATVAGALNDRALAATLGSVEPADLNGRRVQVLGVAWRDAGSPDGLPFVVPVQLSVGARR
jgi:predicted lipoprotein